MKPQMREIEKEYISKLISRIIAIRKEKQLTQEDLAYKSDVARSLIYSYEKEERNMSFGNLIRIIKFGFEMNVEDFFAEGFDSGTKKSKKKK